MEALEIVEKFLRENAADYDGLCSPDLECGCETSDLARLKAAMREAWRSLDPCRWAYIDSLTDDEKRRLQGLPARDMPTEFLVSGETPMQKNREVEREAYVRLRHLTFGDGE